MQLCTFIYLNILIKNFKFVSFDTRYLPVDLITFLTSDFPLFIFNIYLNICPLLSKKDAKTC